MHEMALGLAFKSPWMLAQGLRAMSTVLTRSSVILIAKASQANESLRLDVTVFDALSPSHAKRHRDIVPHFAIVKGPPLPATVLSSKASDYLLAARMGTDIGCAVKHYIIYHDP